MVEVRRAGEEDLEFAHRVFVAAEGSLWARHGFDWPAPPFELWAPTQRHVLREDGERAFVALDQGRIVGFTAAIARGDTWYFSSLFVLPDYQGQGVGRVLLERAWRGEFARRITITDSFQPLSNGLYARRGLIPTTPILSLAGTGTADAPSGLMANDPDAEVLAALHRAVYGFERAVDHRFWHEQKGAPTVWARGAEPVGYAYVASSGQVGPLVGCDATVAAEILHAELARRQGQPVALFVPGTARTLVQAAVDAGLRFSRPPGLLLLSERCQAPTALAISGYFLY